MRRSIASRLSGSLRQQSSAGWSETTAVLIFPTTVSAAAPRWRPGNGYVEVRTASVWARIAYGPARAVVIFDDGETGEPVMVTGMVEADRIVGRGGLADKPRRISWLAETPAVSALPADHPALAYRGWILDLEGEFNGLPRRLLRARRLGPARARVLATPRGYQATVEISVAPWPWRQSDINAYSAVLAGLLRHYGKGTRLRFHCAPFGPVVDPLHYHAQEFLSVGVLGHQQGRTPSMS